MATHDLLWAKILSLELKKLESQTPKLSSQNKQLSKLDFQCEETTRDGPVNNQEPLKNSMMDSYIQLSFDATTKVKDEDGFILVKSFTGDVISLRDFLNSAKDNFISGTSLDLIGFTQNLVDAINCYYEFETIHNDIRIKNICFHQKEKRFKLVPSHRSIQNSGLIPSALNQDKLGLLLVIFEITQIIPFDEFDPEKLEDYLEKLPQEFADIIRSALSTKHMELDQTIKSYQSLRQSQKEYITQYGAPVKKYFHLEEFPSFPMLLEKLYPRISHHAHQRWEQIERNLYFEDFADTFSRAMALNDINMNTLENLLTRANQYGNVLEKKMALIYPSPVDIHELSITLKVIKASMSLMIVELERFESKLGLITVESTQNEEIFLDNSDSRLIHRQYEKQQQQFYNLWRSEAEEKIHQLAVACLFLEEMFRSQNRKYILISETNYGKYPDPEEMQKINNNAKLFYTALEIIKGIWKKLQSQFETNKIKQNTKDHKEIVLKETMSILQSKSSKEKESLVPALIKIKTVNKTRKKDPSPLISSYYHDFVNLSKNIKKNCRRSKKEMGSEVYYASGCILNYHFWCLKKIKSDQDFLQIFNQGNHIIDTYGSNLEPHLLYKLHKTIPDQEALRKSEEIRARQNSNKHLFDILNQLANDFGTQLVMTDTEGSLEFDHLHILGTGGLSDKFLKVTLTDLDEKDFKKMAEEPAYAEKIYQQFKEAVRKSKIFGSVDSNNIEVIAIECNSPLTAVIPIGSNVMQSIDLSELGRDVMQQTSILRYLRISVNHFDPEGDMEWEEDHHDSEPRGGLDYFFPKGWKGYGLKVLDKYPPDNKWLENWDHTGWAIGYHGVGGSGEKNPGVTIEKILKSQLRPGDGQVYQDEKDVSPFAPWLFGRTVGKGVYFGKKISISEDGYTNVVKLKDGTQYKVLLQCRLNPREVRIPETETDYYIVPETHARPYRILVKEVKNIQSL